MAKSFIPELYRGKRQVYQKLPHHPGICWVWDWSDEKKKYIQRQSGLKYYAYKKISKKQISKSFEELQEAKKWRASESIFSSKSQSKEVLFQEVAEQFFKHNSGQWKITTLELYRSYMRHLNFFSGLPLNQINSYAIDEWLRRVKKPEYLETQHSSRLTFEHELTLLKQILTFYKEYLDETYLHPCRKRHNEDCIINMEKYKQAKDRAKSKYIPIGDCQKFLQHLRTEAQQNKVTWIYYHLAEFQLLSGCRIGEACAINWADIDFPNGQAQVCKTVQWARNKTRKPIVSQSTKTGSSRWVQLPAQLLASLKEWELKSGRQHGLVFSANPFTPLAYRSVQYHYNKAFKALGLPWSSSHILRHSFATLWISLSGGNVQALQSQLGHSSPKQSLHYAKVTEELVQSALRGFENGLAKVIPLTSTPSELGEAGSEVKGKNTEAAKVQGC